MPGRATTSKSNPAKSTTKRADAGPRENEQAAKTEAPTAVQPVEPEDAYLTGVSRSLQRRLLGLNVDGPQGQAKPHQDATAAGLHSTGSYAAPKSAPAKTKSVPAKAKKDITKK